MVTTADNGVVFHQFESLKRHGLAHAIFTRLGGVSAAPFAELNVGGAIGDERERVIENRRRSFEAAGLPFESVADVWQVHSADVVRAEAPKGDLPYLARADALVTDRPGVSLFMRFADCVPILLYDPVNRAIGLVHAGWRGTVEDVAGAAVRALTQHYGSRPSDVLAVIGPSIGPDHYPVGPEVVERVHQAFPGINGHRACPVPRSARAGSREKALLREVNGRVYFDLWHANEYALRRAGVEHVEVSGVCTACNTELYFSHRAEAGKTGRFGAVIALRYDE